MQTPDIRVFHQKLHRWYQAHGRRDLPWRRTRDPYAIYISEIMLQQTQVKTVLERFYTPFLQRFPTLKALADASEKEVLSAWQGLGYYRRARNLRAAAKASAGTLPQTIEALEALPGIGKNTAHAIAAFAFGQKAAVMEANVKRVLSRLYALKSPSERDLWHKAHELLDRAKPFDYNQAMMDLGALVCLPKDPRCDLCPASSLCLGQRAPQHYPAAKQRKAVPVRKKNILVYRNHHGEFHATARAGDFLSGLYHFAEGQTKPARGAKKLGSIRQQYSHFTLDADIYLVQKKTASGNNWHSLGKLKQLPMSKAEEKIVTMLDALP
ncbi:MAG: A/G-specific adenine glycosylase [Alphaproteobacteria bacterium]|nr:A/G-specific adenine glycosylase [Alphaproteobacteria bacterium]